MAASGRLCGCGAALPSWKRPRRGPITSTAASATQPPTECTTVEPATSTKPNACSQPAQPPSAPAQAHPTATGSTSATRTPQHKQIPNSRLDRTTGVKGKSRAQLDKPGG